MIDFDNFCQVKELWNMPEKNWLTYLTGFDFKEVVRILDEKASQKWEAFEVLTYLRAILNFFFKVSCKVGPSVRTSFHTSSNADESNVVRRFADATNTLGAIHILRKTWRGEGMSKSYPYCLFSVQK